MILGYQGRGRGGLTINLVIYRVAYLAIGGLTIWVYNYSYTKTTVAYEFAPMYTAGVGRTGYTALGKELGLLAGGGVSSPPHSES